MTTRLYALLALMCLKIAPAGYSQDLSYPPNLDGSQSIVDGSQSVDCTDPVMAAANANCVRLYQNRQNGQDAQSGLYPATGYPLTPNTPNVQQQFSGASENAPLNQVYAARIRQQALTPELPTEFQKFVAATTGQFLSVYGTTLFQNVPSTFAPNNLGPVTPDYIIGPDDELRIRIWGQFTYSGNLRVDRSGNVFLPQAGEVHVAGLRFSDLDLHIRQALSRVYRNFDISVDMGRIRSIQVYVTGRARRPGAYTVSSLSTLVNTLFASGGPSREGSLRHILVNRNGNTVTDFDLYALLIQGDKSKDVRLLPDDVIYIPPAGPQVAVTGSVREPAIYELRANETVGDLLKIAGEISNIASNSRISLDRVDGHRSRQAMEVAFDAESLKMPVINGDILRVYSILPAYQKTVTLRGNVANPGRFGWHPGMHLSELIPDRDSLLSRDYWWKRSHLGLPTPEFEPVISTMGRDGRTPEVNSQGFTTAVSQEALTSVLARPPQQSSGIPNDQPQNEQDRPVEVNNAIGATSESSELNTRQSNPAVRPGEPIGLQSEPARNDVYLAAPEINWDYAVIERINPETLKSSLIPFDLGKLVQNHDAHEDLALQPGDTVTIFSQADIRVPQAERTKYVRLDGEFVHAGIYSVQPGETLRELAKRAGGITPDAYLYGSEFTRESTRKLQQQRLDEYVQSVSLEAERGTRALAISGSSGGASSANVAASREVTQAMINRLRQVRATGRVVLSFNFDSHELKDIPALKLENGDHFSIPTVPETVNVVGAVYDQNSFIYRARHNVGQYLALAGGPTRNADTGHSFVIRADGSVISKKTAKNHQSVWSGDSFKELKVYPGDSIVIPDKTLRPSAMGSVMQWTQVFSQLAFGAAAINAIQ